MPVGQITSGQQDVVLPPWLTQRDTMRGSAGLTNMMQQHCPKSQMSSQAYANYATIALSELNLPMILYVLVYVLVFALGFQAAMFTYES